MQTTTAGMLLVRSSQNPFSVLQAVKNSAVGPARDAPVRDIATMEQIIAYSMARRRGIAVLLGVFAAVAWLLSALGIYSVVSYATSRRVREIGIRVALGAQPGQVMWLVMSAGDQAFAPEEYMRVLNILHDLLVIAGHPPHPKAFHRRREKRGEKFLMLTHMLFVAYRFFSRLTRAVLNAQPNSRQPSFSAAGLGRFDGRTGA